MVKERKFGLMEQVMKVNIKMEKRKGEELFVGLIVQFILENFIKITFKEKENIPGMMEENIKELGKIIKWMVKE